MSHKRPDRVEETSTTTGTGAFTLAGAVAGFQSVGSLLANGDTAFFYVEAVDSSGVPTGDWLTFLGTYNSGAGTVSRTTILASSAGGTTNVSFAAGTKRIGIGLVSRAVVETDKDGNLVIANNASAPPTPAADTLVVLAQRIAASGGRALPRILNEDGIYTTLQAHWGRNAKVHTQAHGGITTGGFVYDGFNTGLSTIGTATARTVATTNRFTRARRLAYVSAATGGSAAGLATLNAATHHHWTVGGASGAGFLAIFRFGVSDPATVAGAHMFVGLHNTSGTPSVTGNPNAYTNAIGLAQLNGGANLNIVYGGSAAQTPIDLGANFPAGSLSADWYELILYARPDVNQVAYRVERINTGDVASGVLTGTAGTALPANTTLLGPRMWRSNNATALAVGIDIGGLYIESDV